MDKSHVAHIDTHSQASTQEARSRIVSLLADLPPEAVKVVEQFVAFLHEQAQEGQFVTLAPEQKEQPPYRYPTQSLPASALDDLIGIMPPVGGDALADTEALYDGV